jgi:endoglucanase
LAFFSSSKISFDWNDFTTWLLYIMAKNTKPPAFLVDLLNARSPSGYETEAQAVVDKYVKDAADEYRKDGLGNRIATIKSAKGPTLMMTGHMDELGLIITYVDDKGFLYFDTVGGIDLTTISGRRVSILTEKGIVKGVTGRRAIHLLNAEERKKIPEKQNLWIDIGVKDKAEALKKIQIGDVAVYDQSFEMMTGSIGIARAFDNKSGCYVVCEALRRLAKDREGLNATVVSVATSQEEIGCRGARAVATGVKADFAIAVDVGHATDHPECDNRRFGENLLGGGPIITRGANANPLMFKKLLEIAKKEKIPYQIEADPRPTSTDGRELQMGPGGIPTAVISIPLRYMHTPSEVVDLNDVENTVRLLVAYAKSLKPGDSGEW